LKGSVIIFLETKRGVDYLTNFLNERNYNTISIHGDKTQDRRQNAIECFTKGEVPILIATDVASRGLDFPNIPYVFNFDLPNNIDDYIHRIGRTGRCGNKGTAYSFVTNNCRILKDLYRLFVKSNQEIPDWFENLYQNFDSSNIQTSSNKFGHFGNAYGSSSGYDKKPQYRSSNTPYSNKSSLNTRSNYVTNVPADFFRKGENYKKPENEPQQNPNYYSNSNNSGTTSQSGYKPSYSNSSTSNPSINNSNPRTYNNTSTTSAPKFQRGNY